MIYSSLTIIFFIFNKISVWYITNIKSFFLSSYNIPSVVKTLHTHRQLVSELLNYNNLVLFFISFLLFWLIFTAFRSTLPRVRLDQILDFFWKYLIAYSLVVFAFGLLFMLNFKKLSFTLTKLFLKNVYTRAYQYSLNVILKPYVFVTTWLLTSRFSYYYVFLLSIKNI